MYQVFWLYYICEIDPCEKDLSVKKLFHMLNSFCDYRCFPAGTPTKAAVKPERNERPSQSYYYEILLFIISERCPSLPSSNFQALHGVAKTDSS